MRKTDRIVIRTEKGHSSQFQSGVAYMAGGTRGRRQQPAVSRARTLIIEALDLLDAHGGAPQAAAYLELALQELGRAQAG
jgi:hypothetical protein